MKETKKTKIRTVPVLEMDIFEYDVGSRYFRVVAEFTMFPNSPKQQKLQTKFHSNTLSMEIKKDKIWSCKCGMSDKPYDPFRPHKIFEHWMQELLAGTTTAIKNAFAQLGIETKIGGTK